ncbi:MAG: potassium channel family protein [Thermoanaerobaculia bacterium]
MSALRDEGAAAAQATASRQDGPYLLFMLALSLLALGLLGAGVFLPLGPDESRLLSYADNAVCVLFLLDFFVTLARAENRWKYFVTWGWIDLLSSIPAVDALRVGRMARVLRILRVLRGVRSAKILAEVLLRRRAEGAFLAVCLVSILLVFTGSVAILHFETAPESNIKGPEDALWWAVVTLTTVGYGDRFPVTTEGRVLAALLMTAGVGLFGTLSGFVASWFLKAPAAADSPSDSDVATLRAEVARLRAELAAAREGDGGTTGGV